ncbi:type VI secretion protein ImpA [Salmonella enterica subsp. enterica]|nr:type VI secretion protein ImpA [Salmonella enterica subsp. enterica serovar Lexington]
MKTTGLLNILKRSIMRERIMHDAKTMPARQFILLRTMSHP